VDGKQIESADLDGKNRRTIIAKGLKQPLGMTQFGDFVYWTDIERYSVERASKSGSLSSHSVVKANLTYPFDILVYHQSRQQGTNACAFSNGDCSHLCVPKPRDVSTPVVVDFNEPLERICTCPTHHKLTQPGGTKCQGPSSFVLFSQYDRISRLVMDTDDCPDVILPIPSLKNVQSIAYDQRAKVISFSNLLCSTAQII
jgi:low density lipoprotein receptor-related protein 5/6